MQEIFQMRHQSPFKGMSLYTEYGERKYLSQDERKRFCKALDVIDDPKERLFCEMIYWTGCRPTEARNLIPFQIDPNEYAVVIRSLKKRGELKGRHFRPVPVPVDFIERLDEEFGIRDALRLAAQGNSRKATQKLWPFGRTKGWGLVNTVMRAANVYGVKGCARGLRHTLGVQGAVSKVPDAKLQSWLGHATLETTAIYMNAIGPEDHAIASRMWH